MSDLQPHNDQSNIMRESVDKLAGGLLQEYEPTLKTLQTHLNELTNKQQQLVTQVETENMRLKRIEKEELKDMCRVIKSYQIRLQNIKKDMILLSGRSLKLKNRAIKLHRLKQNEALEREQQREAQLTREQELIAKPSNKS